MKKVKQKVVRVAPLVPLNTLNGLLDDGWLIKDVVVLKTYGDGDIAYYTIEKDEDDVVTSQSDDISEVVYFDEKEVTDEN